MIAQNPMPDDDPLAELGITDGDVEAAQRKARRKAERADQELFLAEYRKLGQKRSAAHFSGVGWGRLLRWERTDKRFVRKCEEAYQLHVEGIIQEAYRRAIVGEPRLKFHKGDVITIRNEETGEHEPYVEYKKSDRLLLELIAVLDGRFGQRGKSDVTVNVESNVALQIGVVEDPGFYGNEARLQDAEAAASPVLCAERSEPVQVAGLRETVGEDVLRSADDC